MTGRALMVAPAVLLLLIAYLAGRAAWEGLTLIIAWIGGTL